MSLISEQREITTGSGIDRMDGSEPLAAGENIVKNYIKNANANKIRIIYFEMEANNEKKNSA